MTDETKSVAPGRLTGIRAQRLKPITLDQTIFLLLDPRYMWQEVMEGDRCLIRKNGSVVTASTRKGVAMSIPGILVDAVRALPIPFAVLDGVHQGDGRYAAFDLISTPADRAGERSFRARHDHLQYLLGSAASSCWAPVPTACTPDEAQRLLQEVGNRNGAGLAGKRADAPVRLGIHQDQVRFRFIEKARLFVLQQRTATHDVAVAAIDQAGNRVSLGYVKVPAHLALPSPGDVIEVEYPYSMQAGRLFQPAYKRTRPNLQPEDCTLDQLKCDPQAYIASADEAAATEVERPCA